MSFIKGFDPVSVVRELEQEQLIPAIIFRPSRRDCDLDCQKFVKVRALILPDRKQLEILKNLEQICERYSIPLEIVKGSRFFKVLVQFGIAPHHAGHLSSWRVVVEQLMSLGCLRAIFATSTVAAGVDFPARTVVITSHKKRGQLGVKTLTATEFHQMAGRAGRRGKDRVGFCLFAVCPENNLRALAPLIEAGSEELKGSYFCSPSTILPMLKYRSLNDLIELVEKSFTVFLEREESQSLLSRAKDLEQKLPQISRRSARKLRQKIAQLEKRGRLLQNYQMASLTRVVSILENLGYIKDATLTEKGLWSAEIASSYLIEISEILASDIMREIDTPIKLATLFGLIAGDESKVYLRGKLTLSSTCVQYFKQTVGLINKLFAGLRPFESFVSESCGYTVYRWLSSSSWKEFMLELKYDNVHEGDVARLISQTADILVQVSKLGKFFPDFAYFAEEARSNLLRPPFSEFI